MPSNLFQVWRYAAVSILLLIFPSAIHVGNEKGLAADEPARVLLISSVVDDAEVLADAVAEGVLVICYDAKTISLEDLLSMVKERLKGGKVRSIGLVAHDYGSAKFYLTGSETVNLSSTLNNEEQRQFWRELGSLVATGGHIDLFTCRLAATPEGRMLVSKLSDLSGVPVAASTNETGNPVAGGDWVLETADIDASILYFDNDRLSAFGGLLISEVKKLIASDTAAYDEFGIAVAVSGDYAVVGATKNSDAGDFSGSAYIFTRNQGGVENWGEVKKLTASDAATLDVFGRPVSISGDYIIVGATGNSDAGDSSGSAYIFARNQGGADNWGEVRKLTASDAGVSDQFGISVAISGDHAIVGARYNSSAGLYAGSAYIFARNQGGADNWGEVKKIIASDTAAGDNFGESVSISGDFIVVGAAKNADAGPDSGSSYIFARNQGGADNWGEVKKLTASDAATGDWFGYPVVISGDLIVIGATGNSDGGPYSGSAYIINRNQGGADNWGEVKKITASDAAADDRFGGSLAISGDFLVVGAHLNDDAGTNSGSAYLFARNLGGTNNWGEVEKFTASDAAAEDYFGFSVGISGNFALIGAIGDDDAGTASGSAYFFHLDEPSLSNPTATKIAPDSATFGATVYDGGDAPITERGVVWSTSPSPTVSSFDGKATVTGTLGTFTVSATGLSLGTTYYYRGYATNAIGTGYSPEGTFIAQSTGSLQVMLAPPSAVAAGARWRVVGQIGWRNSGEFEYGMPLGNVTVEFKPVEGYISPANISARILANQTTSITAEYLERGGTVRVKLLPMSVRKAGAAWGVKGSSQWLHSGDSVGLPVGVHTLVFKPLPGWIGFDVQVNVKQGDDLLLTCQYLPFLVSDCSDYEGDGDCNCSLWNPASFTWSANDLPDKRFGEDGAWPAPGDYDGDGKVELAYWHPGKGLWRIKGGEIIKGFGSEGDLPVPADYDGDGLTDPAIYRPTTGEWFIHESSSAPANAKQFVLGGGEGQIPVPGDYDGDGLDEAAVYDFSTRTWTIGGGEKVKYGREGEFPVPADYNGDGTTDIALIDLKKGLWRVKDQFSLEIKSKVGDIPVPGDYNGDGKFEPSLYRPKKGAWFFVDGSKIKHGSKDDIPLVRGR